MQQQLCVFYCRIISLSASFYLLAAIIFPLSIICLFIQTAKLFSLVYMGCNFSPKSLHGLFGRSLFRYLRLWLMGSKLHHVFPTTLIMHSVFLQVSYRSQIYQEKNILKWKKNKKKNRWLVLIPFFKRTEISNNKKEKKKTAVFDVLYLLFLQSHSPCAQMLQLHHRKAPLEFLMTHGVLVLNI